jgi:hypothetical protein
MIGDDSIEVVVGGTTYQVPPMTFYVLKRAWPHVMRLIRMAPFSIAVGHTTERLIGATRNGDPESVIAELTARQGLAVQQAEDAGADFIAQTDEALQTVAAALALTPDPPSFDTLSKALRPDEFQGVHAAFHKLLAASGFGPGETMATSLLPTRQSTGIGLPQSSSPTA